MSLTTTAEPSGRRAFAFSNADATDSETMPDWHCEPMGLGLFDRRVFDWLDEKL